MDSLIQSIAAECGEFRHRLHQHPELSGGESNTRDALIAELKSLGFVPQAFEKHMGIVALWPGENNDVCLALRADMDALPLHEDSGVPWTSQNSGVMHACGHDGHMAILLGVARWLAKTGKRHPQAIKLIFQPSEEAGNGARKMMLDGVLENPKTAAIFGLHGWPELAAGSVAVPDRAVMAAVDNFNLLLRGRGGHGAMPHLTRDPVVAAAALITSAQSLVSRRVSPLEPAVLTFGNISAGEAPNVIPETCLLRGTMRSFDPALRKSLKEDFDTLAKHIAGGMGVTAELEWHEACPATLNDPAMAALARDSAIKALGKDCLQVLPPSMGGEDFAFFLEKVPGAYFWLGLGMKRGGLHNPRFDFNDEVMASGIAVFASIIERFAIPA